MIMFLSSFYIKQCQQLSVRCMSSLHIYFAVSHWTYQSHTGDNARKKEYPNKMHLLKLYFHLTKVAKNFRTPALRHGVYSNIVKNVLKYLNKLSFATFIIQNFIYLFTAYPLFISNNIK